MSDSFRPSPPQEQWSTPHSGGNGHQGAPEPGYDGSTDAGDVGKALVVGLLGGLISAAGYMVYRRLPDEQKEKLHAQVREVVTQRVNELRRNFNI